MLLHVEMVLDWIKLNQICQNTWNPHQFYTTHETATCRVTFSKHAYIPDDFYDRRNHWQTFQLKENTWSSFGLYWYLNYRSVISITNRIRVSDWVSVVSRPFSGVSAIWWREVNYQWDDDDVRFVLDQHTSLHSDTLFWFRADQSLLFRENVLKLS
jgi:hypothetical protein